MQAGITGSSSTVRWSPNQTGQAVRGYITNEYGEPAEPLRLLAQALDASGAVVGQQIAWVPRASVDSSARTSTSCRTTPFCRLRLTLGILSSDLRTPIMRGDLHHHTPQLVGVEGLRQRERSSSVEERRGFGTQRVAGKEDPAIHEVRPAVLHLLV